MLIPLNHGRVAEVDDADAEWLLAYPGRWSVAAFPSKKIWYATTRVRLTHGKRGKQKVLFMHRLIAERMGIVAALIDHIDTNGLNNCRANLRGCSIQGNRANARKLCKSSSRFKGVTWNKKLSKWQAGIKCEDRSRHLGMFLAEEDAARAYDTAALQFFGAFARTNQSLGLL